jgi:hypothetical protein
MTNQVAQGNKKEGFKQPAKSTPRKESLKTRDNSKEPNQRDASDLPSGWVFAT